jgi:hypothetical protein
LNLALYKTFTKYASILAQFTIRFISTILSTSLALASTTYAWAQAADGTWVAKDQYYLLANGQGEKP